LSYLPEKAKAEEGVLQQVSPEGHMTQDRKYIIFNVVVLAILMLIITIPEPARSNVPIVKADSPNTEQPEASAEDDEPALPIPD